MADSVLVAYATRSGSTKEVSEAVAATLREHGLAVEIQPMKAVSSLIGYHAVVLGAPLIMHHWHKDARRFLSRHHATLEKLPVAVFALGPVHDDEKEWQGVRDQLDSTLSKFPGFKPIAVDIFGGRFDPTLLGFPWKLVPGLKKIPSSDIRDWTAIRTWARNLSEKFQSDLPEPISRPSDLP
jgi:menaquinone-dependent protoporphyrinogen oxidase